MFRGNHPARVDEKSRLKLPADFKAQLAPDTDGRIIFYITSKDGARAELWPIKAWEEIEAKLALLPSTNPQKKKFLDVTNYYGQMAEMDSQGRLLLPQILRESAALTADVVVLGNQTYLEVIDRKTFAATQPKLSVEDLSGLSDLGI